MIQFSYKNKKFSMQLKGQKILVGAGRVIPNKIDGRTNYFYILPNTVKL